MIFLQTLLVGLEVVQEIGEGPSLGIEEGRHVEFTKSPGPEVAVVLRLEQSLEGPVRLLRPANRLPERHARRVLIEERP